MKFDCSQPKNKRINYLIEYFDGQGKNSANDVRYTRAAKLEAMIKIYNSDLIEIEKVKKMSEIYPKASDFIKQFSDIEEYSDDETVGYFANAVKVIGSYYQEQEAKGIKQIGKELMELENSHFFDDYFYACDFVKEYIMYSESPYIQDFLKSVNLKQYQFDRFAMIVMALNEDLYEELIRKEQCNQTLRRLEVMQKVENIKNGVNNGSIRGNEPYDVVEFYKNIPFYDRDSSAEIMEDFDIKKGATVDLRFKSLFEKLEPSYSKSIQYYMTENKLHFGFNEPMLTEKEIRDTKYISNGVALTDEDKENMINYMKSNHIPFLIRAFNAVKEKYLTTGLDLGFGKKLKKRG